MNAEATWTPLRIVVLASIVSVLGLVVGSRGVDVGTDTVQYIGNFGELKFCQCLDPIFEPGFQLLTLTLAELGASPRVYLMSLSAAGLLLVFAVSRSVGLLAEDFGLERNTVADWTLMLFLVSPFFISSQINLVRQGLAALLVINGLFAWLRSRHAVAVALFGLSVSIHFTAVMLIALLSLVGLSLRWLLGITLGLALLYLAGMSETLLRSASALTGLGIYEAVALYADWADYRAGVRRDFLVFSLGLAAVILLGMRSCRDSGARQLVAIHLKVYLLWLWPFFLLGFANFANRYAFNAWLYFSVAGAGLLAAGTGPQISREARLFGVVGCAAVGAVFARLGVQL